MDRPSVFNPKSDEGVCVWRCILPADHFVDGLEEGPDFYGQDIGCVGRIVEGVRAAGPQNAVLQCPLADKRKGVVFSTADQKFDTRKSDDCVQSAGVVGINDPLIDAIAAKQ